MSQANIIEVSSYTAGLVVRDERGFRFFSAERAFDRLDGHRFSSVRAADRAANLLVERGSFSGDRGKSGSAAVTGSLA